MNKYKTVDEFLSDQTPEKLEQINTLRKIIMRIEPTLIENIKWNAPNYVYKGEDRITFNLMNRQNQVKVLIHMGATKKENKAAKPVLVDDEGIVEWNSDIRGTLAFKDLQEITSREASLEKVIKRWLAIIV